jgi:hypothetical protein
VEQVLESIMGYLSTLGTILMETGARLAMNSQDVLNSPLSGYGSSSNSTMVFNLAFAPLIEHLGPLLQNFGGILSALAHILQQNSG